MVGGQGFPNGDLTEKVRPICVITSFFAKMPALLARSAAGLGLQTTTPVVLLREVFGRWPLWSSPSKRSVLAAISEDQRSSVSSQTWPVIFGIRSLSLPQKSVL
jgi:hypothetical protein